MIEITENLCRFDFDAKQAMLDIGFELNLPKEDFDEFEGE